MHELELGSPVSFESLVERGAADQSESDGAEFKVILTSRRARRLDIAIMKTKLRITVVLLFCGVLGLSGCSEKAPSKEKTSLVVWHLEPTPAFVEALDNLASELEERNPGLKVELVNKAWNTVGAELAQAIQLGRGPDVAMVEPYMMSSLVEENLIEPLDDIYEAFGIDDFYPFLRKINTFKGKFYGVPHAYGVGYFSVRRDLLELVNLPEPKDWESTLLIAESTKSKFASPVQLCGGTSFLLEQLFVSLLASNGGKLFEDTTNRPLLNSPEVVETLEFFDKLASYAPEDWRLKPYQDTFVTYANMRAMMVPLTAARTVNQIKTDAPEEKANDSFFGVFPTPIGPSGERSVTFIDAEPWVVFSDSKSPEIAKEFLLGYFSDEHYLSFCKSVPLHLCPSRKSLSEEYFRDPVFNQWKSWVTLQTQLIEGESVLPLLSSTANDHLLPFLWEFNQEKILTDMVSAEGRPAKVRAEAAQRKAEALVERLGFKKWD